MPLSKLRAMFSNNRSLLDRLIRNMDEVARQHKVLQVKSPAPISWMLVMIAVACSACGDRTARSAKGVEQLAQVAPDGVSKAFVWLPETDGYLGATVSTFYQVWIQDLHRDKEEQLLLNGDKTSGFELVWTGPRELRICYVKARISSFRNFFVVAKRDSPDIYEVEIELRKVPRSGQCQENSDSSTGDLK